MSEPKLVWNANLSIHTTIVTTNSKLAMCTRVASPRIHGSEKRRAALLSDAELFVEY